MPIVSNSSYKSPYLFRNRHVSTIYNGRIKRFLPPDYTRIKLDLEDGDFINVDFIENQPKKALILCHGLEGDSKRTYNNSSADYFLKKNFSIFAWNNRSCGGEMNLLPQLYHHAVIEDLDRVVQFVLEKGYREVYLLGFSMGAAQVLNYLGAKKVDDRIKSAVAISVPIKLKSCSDELKKGFNRVYLNVFTKKIKKKFSQKSIQFPDFVNADKIQDIKSFDEIDEFFTAPLHGFINKDDYYEKASPAYVMENINIPVLILNALNDPFLGDECYPIETTRNHPFVHLEISKYGGHCAFPIRNSNYSYSEIRAYEFFNSKIVSKGF